MTEPAIRSDGPAAAPAPAARLRKGRWQVGLRTLFLLICAVGAWLGVMMNRSRTEAMRSGLHVLRSFARELEVDDPAQIAVVQKLEQWMDEERWDLYLPPGSYRICMATRTIGASGLPPVMTSEAIGPGRHRLALDQRTEPSAWKAVLTCDGSERLTLEEPKTFPGNSASTADMISTSQQFPVNAPVILYHRQFWNSSGNGVSLAPTRSSDGLMLWIEPAPAPTRGR